MTNDSDDMPCRCVVCQIECHLTCSACKSVVYCSREHQRTDHRDHKKECRILVAAASHRDGVVFAQSAENSKRLHASSADDLIAAPLIIAQPLYGDIEQRAAFFHQGEWISSPNIRDCRYLATVSVLTCTVVFAYSGKVRLRQHGPRVAVAFGAHIDMEAFYTGERRDHKHPFSTLTSLLSDCFGPTTPTQDFNVVIVGGHSLGSPESPGGGSQARFNSQLQKALSAYPVDRRLFELFPGARATQWAKDPMATNSRLYAENQAFFTVALDVVTGDVVAHNDFVSAAVGRSPLWPSRQVICYLNRDLRRSNGKHDQEMPITQQQHMHASSC